jgi:hypothetical protein
MPCSMRFLYDFKDILSICQPHMICQQDLHIIAQLHYSENTEISFQLWRGLQELCITSLKGIVLFGLIEEKKSGWLPSTSWFASKAFWAECLRKSNVTSHSGIWLDCGCSQKRLRRESSFSVSLLQYRLWSSSVMCDLSWLSSCPCSPKKMFCDGPVLYMQ